MYTLLERRYGRAYGFDPTLFFGCGLPVAEYSHGGCACFSIPLRRRGYCFDLDPNYCGCARVFCMIRVSISKAKIGGCGARLISAESPKDAAGAAA